MLSGYLDSYVTFNVVDETSDVKSMEKMPVLFFCHYVNNLLEEIDET